MLKIENENVYYEVLLLMRLCLFYNDFLKNCTILNIVILVNKSHPSIMTHYYQKIFSKKRPHNLLKFLKRKLCDYYEPGVTPGFCRKWSTGVFFARTTIPAPQYTRVEDCPGVTPEK